MIIRSCIMLFLSILAGREKLCIRCTACERKEKGSITRKRAAGASGYEVHKSTERSSGYCTVSINDVVKVIRGTPAVGYCGGSLFSIAHEGRQ